MDHCGDDDVGCYATVASEDAIGADGEPRGDTDEGLGGMRGVEGCGGDNACHVGSVACAGIEWIRISSQHLEAKMENEDINEENVPGTGVFVPL